MDFVLARKDMSYLLSILVGTLFLIAIDPVKIFVPGYPIPWILQNTAVLFVALLSPGRTGLISVALMLGVKSLTVATFGLACGYFVGYFVAALFLSSLPKKTCATFRLKALLFGSAIILFFGWGQMACVMGSQKAFALGVAPFLVSDFVKVVVGCALFTRIERGISARK